MGSARSWSCGLPRNFFSKDFLIGISLFSGIMHLTRILLRTVRSKIRDPKVPKKSMPGNIWSGKHRLYEKVTVSQKREAVKQILLEEQNREYLSIPYLTAEQEDGHMAEKDREQHFKRWEQKLGENM